MLQQIIEITIVCTCICICYNPTSYILVYRQINQYFMCYLIRLLLVKVQLLQRKLYCPAFNPSK